MVTDSTRPPHPGIATMAKYRAIWAKASANRKAGWAGPILAAALAGALAGAAPCIAQVAPDYAPAPSAQARSGPALPIGRCINFGNTLEAPHEGDWGYPIRDEDLARVKADGFVTVRLPIRFSDHAARSAPYRLDPALLERVAHLVRTASALSLNVIIDLHHYDRVMADPARETDRFAAIWSQIAERFADAPPTVWFELLNEPKDALTNSTLPALWRPALAAIRKSNPTRPVILGGSPTSTIESLDDLELPEEPYVVPTFHYYEPLAFTHQGASYLRPVLPKGRKWGDTADMARLAQDLARVRRYIARTGRVPFIGEFGAIQSIPHNERLHYYITVSRAFASIGIASCAWSYRNTFQLAGRRHWRSGFPYSLGAPLP